MIGMTPPFDPRIVAALLATVAVAACGRAGASTMQTAPAPQPAAAMHTTPEAIAKARADSARHPYTKADVDFMSGMISHHAQAIAMARWAPTHGAGRSVHILAERIINAQQDEIVLAQQWLHDRLQPVPEARPTGMRMMMNGMEHDVLMPGMLTEDQMKRLDLGRGTEFDRLFLAFMIQHHKGAVAMVTELFGSYGAGIDETVFKFASDVNVDQSTEIARMEKMLVALLTAPQ